MKKNIAIVILNWNGEKNTIACLESVNQLAVGDFTVQTIVVDNGSEKEFKIQNLEFKIEEIKIIRSEQNLGFAGGNNMGIRYALEHGADYVVILNNDTLVEKNLINELLKIAQSDGPSGIIAPKIYFAPHHEFHKDRYKKSDLGKVIWYAGGVMDWANVLGHHRGVDEVDYGQYDTSGQTDFASGCCMLLSKQCIEKVGMFDEKYFLYYEDSDLCERAKKAGFTIVYAPKAVLWHKNAGSAGGSGSTLQDYYITRNRLLFGMRYAPLRSKLALLREASKLARVGRPWQKKGAVDFLVGKFGKGSYGS